MSTLDARRLELGLLVAYLNKAEARDKICRAIQYGSKFISDGKPSIAQNVDKATSLARKVFRLFKVFFCKISKLWNISIHIIMSIFSNCSLWMTCMLLSPHQFKELLFQSSYLERYQKQNSRVGNIYFPIFTIIKQHSCFLQSKNALLSTFLFLDQIVWAGRTGIYKVFTLFTLSNN